MVFLIILYSYSIRSWRVKEIFKEAAAKTDHNKSNPLCELIEFYEEPCKIDNLDALNSIKNRFNSCLEELCNRKLDMDFQLTRYEGLLQIIPIWKGICIRIDSISLNNHEQDEELVILQRLRQELETSSIDV